MSYRRVIGIWRVTCCGLVRTLLGICSEKWRVFPMRTEQMPNKYRTKYKDDWYFTWVQTIELLPERATLTLKTA